MGIISLVSLVMGMVFYGQDWMQFNSRIKDSSMPSAKQFNVAHMKDNARMKKKKTEIKYSALTSEAYCLFLSNFISTRELHHNLGLARCYVASHSAKSKALPTGAAALEI